VLASILFFCKDLTTDQTTLVSKQLNRAD